MYTPVPHTQRVQACCALVYIFIGINIYTSASYVAGASLLRTSERTCRWVDRLLSQDKAETACARARMPTNSMGSNPVSMNSGCPQIRSGLKSIRSQIFLFKKCSFDSYFRKGILVSKRLRKSYGKGLQPFLGMWGSWKRWDREKVVRARLVIFYSNTNYVLWQKFKVLPFRTVWAQNFGQSLRKTSRTQDCPKRENGHVI